MRSTRLSVVILLFGILGWTSCSETSKKANNDAEMDPNKKALFRIDSLENVIRKAQSAGKMPEIKTTLHLAQAYEYYAFDYPEDTMSGVFLRKAGELYEMILQDKPKAIKRYMQAYREYQEFDQRPMALFRASSLYQDLGDTTRAIEGFKLFMKNHPQHNFADDAENMIKITRIGMDNFIRQSIEKSQQEQVQ